MDFPENTQKVHKSTFWRKIHKKSVDFGKIVDFYPQTHSLGCGFVNCGFQNPQINILWSKIHINQVWISVQMWIIKSTNPHPKLWILVRLWISIHKSTVLGVDLWIVDFKPTNLHFVVQNPQKLGVDFDKSVDFKIHKSTLLGCGFCKFGEILVQIHFPQARTPRLRYHIFVQK